MPRLIALLPCEKILIDENHTASLIVLLQTVTAQVPPNAAVPTNAVAAKEWGVFTVWEPSTEDVGRSFSQIVQVMLPDETEFKRASLAVHFHNDRPQQVGLNVFGFPIGQLGKLTFKVWLEHNGQRIGEIHSCPVWVDHKAEVVAATP